MDAVAAVADEARELIRRRNLDPDRDPGGMRRLVEDLVADYDERSLSGTLPPVVDLPSTVKQVMDAVVGFGPLQPYLDDPEVEEVWINEPGKVFVARRGISELTTTILTDGAVRDLVERMLKTSGRRVDLSSPFVDATLPDGSRLHVVIPDITRRHWAVNIRKFVVRADRLADLVALGTIGEQAARFLDAAVVSGLNVLVSGGTQAGKTTLLNCLAAAVPARERVITCEEVFELKVPGRDVVGLQCRQPSLEGTGEVPLRRLVKEALRMRPSRIIVGEVRQEESLDLLIALNSGSAGHVHRARQQRPRGRHEDVHPAAAGRGERLGRLRGPDRGVVDRPGGARRAGRRRQAPGARGARRAGPGRGRRRRDRVGVPDRRGRRAGRAPAATRRTRTASPGPASTSRGCSRRDRGTGS